MIGGSIQPDSKIQCPKCTALMVIEEIKFRITDGWEIFRYPLGSELRRAKVTCDACGYQYFVIQIDSEMNPKPPQIPYEHPQRRERYRRQHGLSS
jgi:C4-type Zn-finger protein